MRLSLNPEIEPCTLRTRRNREDAGGKKLLRRPDRTYKYRALFKRGHTVCSESLDRFERDDLKLRDMKILLPQPSIPTLDVTQSKASKVRIYSRVSYDTLPKSPRFYGLILSPETHRRESHTPELLSSVAPGPFLRDLRCRNVSRGMDRTSLRSHQPRRWGRIQDVCIHL